MKPWTSEEAIAIVGYGYRMPGSIRTEADFWSLLSQRGVVQEPIVERYGKGYRPLGQFHIPNRFASPYEGLVPDEVSWLFDRSFFEVSHNEMVLASPHLRMIMNSAWEALEHAGWDLYSMHNSQTGVFVGAQTLGEANWRPLFGVNESTVAGISMSMLANRISYFFNLMGPSMTCCTACSAGLSALHTAVNAIHSGDCKQALVGSVNYLGSARVSSAFNALGVISPEGKCHSFDAEANGYMRAEGSFVFAIKPVVAAERDGDEIFAVIEATSINAAGAADDTYGLAKGRSIFAPTQHSQVDLMRTACARASLQPQEFDYIEAHATGTAVGDRIEGNAIGKAFGGRDRTEPLRIASVKSNVGHMESAAFHCALLKVVLMMKERKFAPISRNFAIPNQEIDFDRYAMSVQTDCEPFPDRPVVVGINSFGFGGANGHCVVREYRPEKPRIWSIPLAPSAGYLIPLSARTADALTESARQLRETLCSQSMDLYTLAGNLSRRRTHFPVRAALAVRSQEDLRDALDAFIEKPEPVATANEEEKRLAMVFGGQGTQWAGCGQVLYDSHPVFRRVVDAIDEYWRKHASFSLRAACFTADQSALDECQLAQPVIFMLQCALVEMFKTWGLYPDCVVGHSSGEVAAAYACGALSLEEATCLVFHRSRLQQRTAGSGRMLAIGLDREGVEQLLATLRIPLGSEMPNPGQVEIACENAPGSTVICGQQLVLKPIMAELEQRGFQNQLIPGNIAFHSSAMEPIRDAVQEPLAYLNECAFKAEVPFISSVTGRQEERLDSEYWWKNIRQPVVFRAAMETVLERHRPGAILEVAPHSALQTTIAQCLEGRSPAPVRIPTLMRDSDECLDFINALGALFRAGIPLDFRSQYPRPRPAAHLLPGYPREEETTMDSTIDDELFIRRGEYSHGPLVGHKVPADSHLFESRFSEKDFPWIADHRVYHSGIMPAAGYIELVLEALEGVPVYFEEVHYLQPCPVSGTPVRLQTDLHTVSGAPHEFTFSITSQPSDREQESEVHCRGKVRRLEGDPAVKAPLQLAEIDLAQFESAPFLQGSDFYERIEAVLEDTFHYGPNFRTIQNLRMSDNPKELLVEIEMDAEWWKTGQEEGFVFNPALLDGGLQIFLVYLMQFPDFFAMPKRARGVTFLRPPTSPRITCFLPEEAYFWSTLNDYGQRFPIAIQGELSFHGISFYDTDTGALLAHFDEYCSYNNNRRWAELPNSRHVVSWQPKFIPDDHPVWNRLPAEEIEPSDLITALEQSGRGHAHVCRIIEFAGNRESDQTILSQCTEPLSRSSGQSEYWLVSAESEITQAHYEAFHQQETALRFATFDPAEQSDSADKWTAGLLRPSSAEIIFVHSDLIPDWLQLWHDLQTLAVPGGLVLFSHEEEIEIQPDVEWSTIQTARQTTLLRAPQTWVESPPQREFQSPEWVIGESGSWAADWIALRNTGDIHVVPNELAATGQFDSLPVWPHADDVHVITFFCGLDPLDPTGEAMVTRFVAFISALVAYRTAHADRPCQLIVVTQGAAFEVEEPRGQAMCGAVRSMAREVAEEAKVNFRLVDLGSRMDLNVLKQLNFMDLRESELAVRAGRLWAPRITSVKQRLAPVPLGENPPFRLRLDNQGSVEGLQMKTYALPDLGPKDVEIEVEAAALNFRDVTVTLGMLPAAAYERSALGPEVGLEASGIVSRVGTEVRQHKVGDEVVFIKGGCIANRMVVNEHFVFPKPGGLSQAEAASVLSVYATSYYALIHLARLRAGQRVLIHSAMGGVGQSAIALAQNVGAEIYATAGSEEKREKLLTLGVKEAFDSHSYDWYSELMEATQDEGVDVVLNSLSGRHIELCLQSLRSSGWHCEIGKVDIYADNTLSLAVFRKNLRFAAIDVDRLMLEDPLLTRQITLACLDLLDKGAVPAIPVTVFPYRDYTRALRFMMSGRHQGKLVLEAPPKGKDPDFPISNLQPFLDPEATYLVTGGFGGMGLRLLSYLVVSGARHFTLLDRDPHRKRNVEWVRRESTLNYLPEECEIDIVAVDVANEADVVRCISELTRPLKGVFHLAGVLDDRLLADMSAACVAEVFAPKAQGALNLHRATANCPLEQFVLFSSVASTFGNPGQINYSAASAFLDGLAAYRRRQGLPGLSLNTSAISNTGMASRNLHVLRLVRAAGMPAVSGEFVVGNLDYALRAMAEEDHLVTALFQQLPWAMDSPEFLRNGHLLRNQDAYRVGADSQMTLESLMTHIASKVAELCGHEEGSVEEPLSSFGLNSISVAELGAFIKMQFDYQVSALELMTTASCMSLAEAILSEKGNKENLPAEVAADDAEGTPSSPRTIQREPSTFAIAPAEHFPHNGYLEPQLLERRADE